MHNVRALYFKTVGPHKGAMCIYNTNNNKYMVGKVARMRANENSGYCDSTTAGIKAPHLESKTWKVWDGSKWDPQSSVSVKSLSQAEHKAKVTVRVVHF